MVVLFHASKFGTDPFYLQGAKVNGGWSAVLSVVALMWIGVPMFFVISGYCISAAIDSSRLKGSSLTTYFKRRFRRIYPPYWIVFALFVGLVLVMDVLTARGFLPGRLHNRTSPGDDQRLAVAGQSDFDGNLAPSRRRTGQRHVLRPCLVLVLRGAVLRGGGFAAVLDWAAVLRSRGRADFGRTGLVFCGKFAGLGPERFLFRWSVVHLCRGNAGVLPGELFAAAVAVGDAGSVFGRGAWVWPCWPGLACILRISRWPCKRLWRLCSPR